MIPLYHYIILTVIATFFGMYLGMRKWSTKSKKAGTYIKNGYELYLENRYQEALVNFNIALSKDPEADEAFLYGGISRFHLKEYDKALFDFNKVVELNKTEDQAYYWRGLTYYQLQRIPESILDLQKASKLGNNEARDFLLKIESSIS